MVFFSVFTQAQTKIDSLIQRLENSNSDVKRFGILDTLTEAMVRKNHPQRTSFLKRTIDLARELGEWDKAVLKLRYVSQEYLYTRKPDSAIYVLDEMLGHRSKFKKRRSVAHLLLKRGGAYFNKEDLKQASKDYERAAHIFHLTKDSIFEADAIYFNGQVQSDLRNFPKAVDQYNKAYALYKSLGDVTYMTHTLSALASAYASNDFVEKANEERQKIIASGLKNKDYYVVSVNAFNIGGGYLKHKDYGNLKKYVDMASHYLDSIPEGNSKQVLQMMIATGYAQYYLEQGDLEETWMNLKRADSLRKTTDAPKYYENNILNVTASYYLRIGKNKKAEQALQKILAKKDRISNKKEMIRAEKQIAEVYAAQKNFKNAYQHLERHLQVKDSAYNTIKTNAFLYYQSLYEAERNENEIYRQKTTINLLEKDKELATALRRTLWIVLFSVILAGTGIAYYIWETGKRKRRALASRLERNKNELLEFTNRLLQKSQEQEVLCQELEQLKLSFGEKEELNTIQELVRSKILTQDDWEIFKEKFTLVYPCFFMGIYNKGFHLTNAEERILALERLHLKTNEIAHMLGISPDSVLTGRYRLRKKLGAPKDIGVIDFLQSL